MPGSGQKRWRGLDPWQLFQRADAWYLVGRCHLHDEPRIFRLDRISKLRGLSSRFTPPADFDLDRFLEDSWSIYATNGQKQEIVLRFHKSLAPLFLNAQHHPGEKVKRMRDGSIDVAPDVWIPNRAELFEHFVEPGSRESVLVNERSYPGEQGFFVDGLDSV